MSSVNGVLLSPKPPLDEAKQACVEVLADALENATNGRIDAVAIVVCMNGGIATVMAGKDAGALNLGCDDLKKKIHAAIFEDGNVAARKRSAIMRAR